MAEIHDRIKEMRLARGLLLSEVAEYLGVKEATAQRYESGSIKNIKHETICKLAELFHCDPTYLMGWSSDVTVSSPSASNIHNSAVVQGNNATTLIVRNGGTHERELSDEEAELLRIYELLGVKGRHALMAAAFELEEAHTKKED
jgi:transcriptional regulator with XRE-family HTH domain